LVALLSRLPKRIDADKARLKGDVFSIRDKPRNPRQRLFRPWQEAKAIDAD
jgi:hypothetical protein